MELRDRIELKQPRPIKEVIAWLESLLDRGFSEDAKVKIGKTTGPTLVLLVIEQRDEEHEPDQNAASPVA